MKAVFGRREQYMIDWQEFKNKQSISSKQFTIFRRLCVRKHKEGRLAFCPICADCFVMRKDAYRIWRKEKI